ncbi:MAG TPA: glycosyl hydrolase, partial [Nitrolancea sp.]|nr:glycosyl hydrolase [Nitrolancea sp.]
RPANRFKMYGRYGENAAPYKSYGRVGGMMMTHYTRQRRTGENDYVFLDAGKNPPDGAIIYYHLKTKPDAEVTLSFLEKDGSEIISFKSSATKGQHPTADAGMNRFVWNLRYPSSHEVPDSKFGAALLVGPVAVPGQYQVRLTVGEESLTQPLEIVRDPRVTGSTDDLKAQFELLLKLRDMLSETHDAVIRLREIRQQIEAWAKRVDDDEVKNAAKSIVEKLNALELELIQPKAGSPLQPPAGLNDKIAALAGMISNADVRPTSQSFGVYDKLAGLADAAIEKLDPIIGYDVASFNDMLIKRGLKPVSA